MISALVTVAVVEFLPNKHNVALTPLKKVVIYLSEQCNKHLHTDALRKILFQSPAGDSDGAPRKRSTDQLNEDMDRMFENEGAKEDFSLSQLSSPATASNPWSPGYSDDSQVREADDMRIHDSDIKCEFAIIILRFIFLGLGKERFSAS